MCSDEDKSRPGYKNCTRFWGCIIFLGIAFLVFGLLYKNSLQQQHNDTQSSNLIECTILSVNAATQCDQERDGCLKYEHKDEYEDLEEDAGDDERRRLTLSMKGIGGANCEEWNLKYYYYYQYELAISAIDICTDDELIENGYDDDKLITFNYVLEDDESCHDDAQTHPVGEHTCYIVDRGCDDTTFELSDTEFNLDKDLENLIIAGAVFLAVGVCGLGLYCHYSKQM